MTKIMITSTATFEIPEDPSSLIERYSTSDLDKICEIEREEAADILSIQLGYNVTPTLKVEVVS